MALQGHRAAPIPWRGRDKAPEGRAARTSAVEPASIDGAARASAVEPASIDGTSDPGQMSAWGAETAKLPPRKRIAPPPAADGEEIAASPNAGASGV
jgi:hypothetical protein